MAEVPTSIAISPSGTTLLNAMQVTTTAGSVLNEVVSLGDAFSGNVGSVLASGAQLVEPGGVNTQPVSGTFFPPTQTVTGTVTIGSPLGQTTMAASIPVVLASNQSPGAFPATQTVSGTVTVTPPATQTVAGTVAITSSSAQTITAAQATAANFNATVIGTVTANAGTNLNTSALALESGGNLAKIASTGGVFGATAPGTGVANGVVAATQYPTAVTNGQLIGAMSDKAGRVVNVLNGPRDIVGTASLTLTTNVATQLIAAGAAGVFNDISTLIITSPMTVAVSVILNDGTTAYTFDLAPNGGIAQNFPAPLKQSGAAASWTAALAATAQTVHCTAIYVGNK